MNADRHALTLVIGAVIRQAVEDAGARGLMVFEPETADGRLVLEIAAVALGSDRVHAAPPMDSAPSFGTADEEWRRAQARIATRDAELLLANAACKTVLLLSRRTPPESLLPLGDLYASAVARLAGGVSIPRDVAELIEAAGGLENVDRALGAWLECRIPLATAMSSLPAGARDAIVRRLRGNRAARRWPHRIPKLSERTLWIDMHE